MPPKEEKKEEKSEEKKPKGSESNDFFSEMVIVFFGFFILLGFIGKLFTGGVGESSYKERAYFFLRDTGVLRFLQSFIISYNILANMLTILFVVGIVYTIIRLHQYELEAQKELYPGPDEETEEQPKNTRWQTVLNHIHSENPSDWRLAILECDILLDEMLDREGYVGDTIGDKLKHAVKGDFQTLDSAWEAHRIRNAIAHEGHDFLLSQREAKRVVTLYESVFKEFDFV